MTLSPALAKLVTLEGKVALVAGAAGGLGSVICDLLGSAGARVISADLPGRMVSGTARHIACDLSQPDSCREMFGQVEALDNGRLDILVHAAGIRKDSVLWKMEDSAWSDVMRVNLDSAFHLLKGAAPLMRAGGGLIVLISSINGQRGKFGLANYSASKAGLIGLGMTAARELGRFNIRVNMLAPGLILTPMTRTLPDKFIQEARDDAVLPHEGTPEDVAAAILFLCCEMSRHITGQVLRVDGGQLIA